MTFNEERSWRALNDKPINNNHADAVANMARYVSEYPKHPSPREQDVDKFIEDMIYCIGSSICDEYQWAGGYALFKERLIKLLMEDKNEDT